MVMSSLIDEPDRGRPRALYHYGFALPTDQRRQEEESLDLWTANTQRGLNDSPLIYTVCSTTISAVCLPCKGGPEHRWGLVSNAPKQRCNHYHGARKPTHDERGSPSHPKPSRSSAHQSSHVWRSLGQRGPLTSSLPQSWPLGSSLPQPTRTAGMPAGSPPSVSSPLVQPSFSLKSEYGTCLKRINQPPHTPLEPHLERQPTPQPSLSAAQHSSPSS